MNKPPRLHKEPRLLLVKAVNSLLLAVEHFNRPWDRGRMEAVIILLDHGFEMLLKAAIVQRGGRIREPKADETIGFHACVRKALSDGKIRFLNEEQAITLQMINALRDAAQHHLVRVSEEQLYFYAQAGVTLFSDLLNAVFSRCLADEMPERVLPVSTKPPTDLATLMGREVEALRALLKPGQRRRVEATCLARGLAIMEAAVQGRHTQPSVSEVNKLLGQIAGGRSWEEIFPGVAKLQLATDRDGIPLQLRIAKKDGVPVVLVPEGTPDASVVAVKRVNELGYYCLGLGQVAEKVGLTMPRTLSVILHLQLQQDPDYFKVIQVGKAAYKRYSMRTVDRIRKELASLDLDDIWERYRPRRHLR